MRVAMGPLIVLALSVLAGCTNPIAFLFGRLPGTTPSSGGAGGSSAGSVVLGTGSINLSGQVLLDDRPSPAGSEVTLSGHGVSTSEQTTGSGSFEFRQLASGAYTLTLSHGGYASAIRAVTLDKSDFGLPPVTLTSPIVALALSAASDSVYLLPEGTGSAPLWPTTDALSATATKQDGLTEALPPASVSYTVSDPSAATVADGVVAVLGSARPETFQVSGQLDGSGAPGASVTLVLRDPQAGADIRILNVVSSGLTAVGTGKGGVAR